MESPLKLYGVIAFSFLAVAVSVALFFIFRDKPLPMPQEVPATATTPRSSVVFEQGMITDGGIASFIVSPRSPNFIVRIKDNRTIVIEWVNLPAKTSMIKIFRSERFTGNWSLWRTIAIVPGSTLSSIAITLPQGEDPTSFSYYFTATSEDGEDLWTSPPTNPVETTSQPAPAPTPTEEGDTATSTSTSIAPEEGGQATSTQEATSTSDQSAPTSTATSTSQTQTTSTQGNYLIYYTPDGKISAMIPIGEPISFSVEHVNKSVVISWQNMPAGADKIIVFRSENSDGPWDQFLEVTSFNPAVPGLIGIVNASVNAPHYYKMDVWSGSQFISGYGPVFLPAAEQ